MRHENSVFHQVLQHLPRREFDRLVAVHGVDEESRRLTAHHHLMALLYAQLSNAPSLRAIADGMSSHGARLYHLGGVAVPRSTLADANRDRPAALFEDLFAALLKQIRPGYRRKLAETVYLIDSTSLRLDSRSARWAEFSAHVCGGKAHIIYDPDADQPIYAAVTPARVNDITAAQVMPVERGATYVFDLGYYDYAWWARLHDAGCRIVTRLKSNTHLLITQERGLPAGSTLISDRVGLLPQRQAKNRQNPFRAKVREVLVRNEKGEILRIVTNDLDAPAQEIADLYKRRWAIELFFRWIKQKLEITRFLGTSENAVRIQVSVALIAYLLLRLAQATQVTIRSPLTFARLVTLHLMERRRLSDLLTPQCKKPMPRARTSHQLAFALCKPRAGH